MNNSQLSFLNVGRAFPIAMGDGLTRRPRQVFLRMLNVTTPTGGGFRTLTVPAEARLITVPEEARRLTIPPEKRSFRVPSEL